MLIAIGYFFVGNAPQAEKIAWGVNFSQKHADSLGLNWRETYLALLDGLGAKELKIASDWDILEPADGQFYFGDLDWQINEAEKRGANVILIMGMKTSRWPECHIPYWATKITKKEQQDEIFKLLEKIVLRYNGKNSIWAWQVENEPLFQFGSCPWQDEEFLKKEINFVKSLDSKARPVIISDSGELSFWFRAARLGDIVGTTLYRKIWAEDLGIYLSYPLPPVFYWRKAELIKMIFGKEVINIELQAEPWGKTLLYDLPLAEQKKSMDLGQFRKNIEFAKKAGFKKNYLWGSEWWYWMKEKQKDPAIWNEAKKLFK